MTPPDKQSRREQNLMLVPEYRVGSGYDVHSFAENRDLYLGGVLIPHAMGLSGHSDADVLIHAIMDALLGAAGLRDIGTYFPPEDDQWKGIRSTVLLDQVCDLIAAENFLICNIDATLIAEAPKIKPHIDEMKSVLGEICGLPENRIGIKATTNEKMGFVGRKEGIAAMASALCYRPSDRS